MNPEILYERLKVEDNTNRAFDHEAIQKAADGLRKARDEFADAAAVYSAHMAKRPKDPAELALSLPPFPSGDKFAKAFDAYVNAVAEARAVNYSEIRKRGQAENELISRMCKGYAIVQGDLPEVEISFIDEGVIKSFAPTRAKIDAVAEIGAAAGDLATWEAERSRLYSVLMDRASAMVGASRNWLDCFKDAEAAASKLREYEEIVLGAEIERLRKMRDEADQKLAKYGTK